MSEKLQKVKDALSKLDASNDNHWTSEGAPRLETLRMLAGDSTISRDDVNAVDQSFTRKSLTEKAAETPSVATESAPAELPVAQVDNLGKMDAEQVNADGPMIVVSAAPALSLQFDASGMIVSGLDQTTSDQLELISSDNSIDNEIESCSSHIASLDAEIAELTQERQRASTALDILNSRKLSAAGPEHLSNQNEIGLYLAQQQRMRSVTAEQLGAFGMRSLPFSNRSKLDQALAARKKAK